MSRWLSVLGISTIAGAGVIAQGPPAAPLFLAVSIDGYISETYAERPGSGAEFVFFTGEPIRYKFVAANQGQPTLTLRFPRRVDAAIEVDRNTVFDNAPANMQTPPAISIRSISRLVSGIHPWPLNDEEIVSLDYEDRIEWHFELNEPLEPGIYRVPIRFTGQDTDGRRLSVMVNEMRFEVRPASKYREEVLVREAYRNIHPSGDLVHAARRGGQQPFRSRDRTTAAARACACARDR